MFHIEIIPHDFAQQPVAQPLINSNRILTWLWFQNKPQNILDSVHKKAKKWNHNKTTNKSETNLNLNKKKCQIY